MTVSHYDLFRGPHGVDLEVRIDFDQDHPDDEPDTATLHVCVDRDRSVEVGPLPRHQVRAFWKDHQDEQSDIADAAREASFIDRRAA